MLNGIDIFYSSENPNNIPSYIFKPLQDVGWHRIINGEATEGFLLQYTENNELGEPIYSNTPNNIVFVKICINDSVINAQPPATTEHLPGGNHVESFKGEIETMGYIKNQRHLGNEGYIRLTTFDSVVADLNNVYIISPWRTGGDLYYIIGRCDEMDMRFFLKRASLALSSLHAIGVSHNDISIENIISANRDNVRLYVENVCICDFGQAMLHLENGQQQYQPFTLIDNIGKFEYTPPECLRAPTRVLGFKIDVYQLGMTCVFALFPHLRAFSLHEDKDKDKKKKKVQNNFSICNTRST